MSKKYYWLKLVNNFFEREDIKILESQENGSIYVLFYLKLLLKSIEAEGALRLNSMIPYDEKMLSVITNTNIDIVRAALTAFKALNLVELLENKTIYMNEIKAMIGSESDSAERVRKHRKLIAENAKSLQCNTGNEKRNTDIDIEKDIEKDIEIKPPLNKGGVGENKKVKFQFPTANSFFNEFWNAYPKKLKIAKAFEWFITNQVDRNLLDIMLASIDEQIYSEQWQREQGRYIPEPINWLQNGSWNDKFVNTFKPIQIEPETDRALDEIYKKIGVRSKL
ncbi:MAG: hypothetical protein A2084_01615 [Tenericutes bacterium GWC2_39_45]|nr:MAG: hypothetical protein A2Y43_03870 [Tenericutes bacterium GWA2_38_26]OHE31193.1 MAG: hypothetical protein A2084_01615 [Tenericutes bacterium GWC2_39_45]OHE31675.1 MAG: hypothetical protein A2009_01770 [Tenericutes bacterium GWD2_38_27]